MEIHPYKNHSSWFKQYFISLYTYNTILLDIQDGHHGSHLEILHMISPEPYV